MRMNSFTYHSEQVHSEFQNGKGQTRRNIVSIRNGKGHKAVETYNSKGRKLNSTKKALTTAEMDCIKKGKFIPGLFRDCVKPLRSTRKQKHRRNH